MAAKGFTLELESPVAPARLFQASVMDAHNLIPKIMSRVVVSGEMIQGDGDVGSVKQFKFTEVIPFKHVSERVDNLDKEKLHYSYSVIEGANVGTKLLSSVYHVKFEPSSNGGCSYKMTAEFTPMEGQKFTDEEVNIGKQGAFGMIKAVEGYLVANPEAYA
ncbi:major strawberry allergen Fra a 1.08-like [Aristolochia californica]|uniref:major strawberry allergen Fra a 1.08-like n=1 Tax=Aristolochia californica TaxID=171875 RepID=UPI0035D810DA